MRGCAAPLVIAMLVTACGRTPGRESRGNAPSNPAAMAVDPVRPQSLVPYLPPAPAGWTVVETKGDTSAFMGQAISTARRTYRGPGSLDVTITDAVLQPTVTTALRLESRVSKGTADAWERGVTLDGNPGVERWQRRDAQAQLTVLVGGRYVVMLRASGQKVALLRDVWGSMDGSGLAGLK